MNKKSNGHQTTTQAGQSYCIEILKAHPDFYLLDGVKIFGLFFCHFAVGEEWETGANIYLA